ncbi:MAG: universal stress protein [Firmicutes bacterium]|nr:universal stress protein [Alicyclobacillaceae bacterium]MCL6498254.1 universal stress protein [Bacillota bacterium]
MEHRIAVAVDGSPASIAALIWALAYVQSSSGALLAVHVADRSALWAEEAAYAYAGASTADMERLTAAWHAHQRAVAHLVEEIAREHHCSVVFQTVTALPGEGGPAAAFLRVARWWGAELLVTGRRRHPSWIDRVLGSFSRWLVAHADLPVVLVPSPATAREAW